jgi:hypothetical protein
MFVFFLAVAAAAGVGFTRELKSDDVGEANAVPVLVPGGVLSAVFAVSASAVVQRKPVVLPSDHGDVPRT